MSSMAQGSSTTTSGLEVCEDKQAGLPSCGVRTKAVDAGKGCGRRGDWRVRSNGAGVAAEDGVTIGGERCGQNPNGC